MFAQVLKKFNPDQPRLQAGQTGGGQWTAEGGGSGSADKPKKWKIFDLFMRLSEPDGGFTYQPVTNKEPKSGYALSIYPDRSTAINGKELQLTDLVSYAAKNSDLFEKKDHYLGAWHDPETGKVYLDVSVVTNDKAKAEKLAKKYDQIAYFDLGEGKSVTVNREATSGGAALKGEHDEPEADYVARAAWVESFLAGGTGGALQAADGQGPDGAGTRGSEEVAGEGGFLEVLKFDPDQPRAPAGSPGGGQWVKGGDTAAQDLAKATHRERSAEDVLRSNLTSDQRAIYDAHRALNRGPSSAAQNTTNEGHTRYTKQRLATHREILNDFFKNAAHFKPQNGEKPEVVLLAGRGGSGKSSFANRTDNGTVGLGAYDVDNHLRIDADTFKDYLARADKKATAYGGVGPLAEHYHEESGRLFDRAVVMARNMGLNTVLDVTMNSPHLGRINAFKKAGYDSSAYLMHLPPQLAADRAMARYKEGGQTGRLVPPEYVLGSRNNEKNFDMVKSKVNRYAIYSNDVPRGESPRHVAGVNLALRRVLAGKEEGFASVLKAGTSEGAYKAWETIKAKYPEKFEKSQAAKHLGVKVSDLEAHTGIGDSKGWRVKDGHPKAGAFIASSVLGKSTLSSQTKPIAAPKPPKTVGASLPTPKLEEKPAQDGTKYHNLMSVYEKYKELLVSSRKTIRGLTPSVKDSVNFYTGSGFRPINKYLGAGKYAGEFMKSAGWDSAAEQTAKKHIANIDLALDRSHLPDNTMLYRSMAARYLLDAVGHSGGLDTMDPRQLVGRTYTERAYSSTSVDPDIGRNSGLQDPSNKKRGVIRLKIEAPKGSKGLFVGTISDHGSEREVILPRNSKFTITKVSPMLSHDWNVTAKLVS